MSKIPILLVSPKSSSAPALPSALSKSSCSVNPRGGGYIRNLKSNIIQNESKSSVTFSRSRDVRINQYLKKCTFGKSSVRLQECDDMLAITISCIMLMASNASDIPKEYLIWANNYLSHIKDNTGKTPMNIRGVLNHIAYLNPNILKSTVCAEYISLNQEHEETHSGDKDEDGGQTEESNDDQEVE